MDKGDPDGDLAGQGPQQWHGLAGDLLLAQLGESSAQDPGEAGECQGGPNLERTKHGKRFHGTVSFDTDTRLKQALAAAIDYPIAEGLPHQRPAVRH